MHKELMDSKSDGIDVNTVETQYAAVIESAGTMSRSLARSTPVQAQSGGSLHVWPSVSPGPTDYESCIQEIMHFCFAFTFMEFPRSSAGRPVIREQAWASVLDDVA